MLHLLLLATSLVAAQQEPMLLDDVDTTNLTLIIPSTKVTVKNTEDKLSLFYDNEGFIVKKGTSFKRIDCCHTEKYLRNADIKTVAKYALFNKFKVYQVDGGDYAVLTDIQLKGGGIFGANAGFFLGKFVVHFAAHSTILIIGACTGPAAPATIAALEATFLPVIETTSNVAGLATGLAGGVATGPI